MDNTMNPRVNIEEGNIKRIVKKNMILLLMGQLVSLFGSSIYSFAIGLYILQETGSGLSFAITIALGSLPRVLFGPIAGVAADRFDRKKMIVYLDILSGIVVLSLLGISTVDSLRLVYIYIATFLLTTCSTFFNTPLGSSIPNLVDDENLTRVNSLSQSVESISSIIGPSIGGFVFFMVDIKLFLLINGLSFIISGISETFIDFNLKDKIYPRAENNNETKDNNPKPETSFIEEFKEGLKYIASHKWLVIMGAFAVLLNMLSMLGLTIPIPYIVNEQWGFSSQQYGVLSMTLPAGMLLGSIILSALPEAKANFKRMTTCLFIVACVVITVGVITSELLFSLSNGNYLLILMGLYLIMAVALIFYNVPFNVTLQRLIPDDKRGRVFGTLGTIAAAFSPIGAILGGILVDKINPWLLPISAGTIMMILFIIMYNTKELKNI